MLFRLFRVSYPLAVLSLLLLVKCETSQIYAPHPLAQEILSARPGHDGKLTNQNCLAYQKSECIKWNTVEYDVSDPSFQDEAVKLNITCRIGTKRYKICDREKDTSGKPMNGFCSITYQQHCFLGICRTPTRIVEFFPIAPYQKVLDSGVRCFNEDIYSEEQ